MGSSSSAFSVGTPPSAGDATQRSLLSDSLMTTIRGEVPFSVTALQSSMRGSGGGGTETREAFPGREVVDTDLQRRLRLSEYEALSAQLSSAGATPRDGDRTASLEQSQLSARYHVLEEKVDLLTSLLRSLSPQRYVQGIFLSLCLSFFLSFL